MKLYRSMLVAAALMACVPAMIACNASGSGSVQDDSSDPPDDTSTEAPPAPQAETPPPAPSPNDVWVVGTWHHEGGKFVWTKGHYEAKREGFTYEQPRWVQVKGRWEHHPGRWTGGPAKPAGKPAEKPAERPAEKPNEHEHR
jgi:hypothetical protein